MPDYIPLGSWHGIKHILLHSECERPLQPVAAQRSMHLLPSATRGDVASSSKQNRNAATCALVIWPLASIFDRLASCCCCNGGEDENQRTG